MATTTAQRPASITPFRAVPFLAAALIVAPAGAAQEIEIGTGSTEGVYYQVGRAICRLVERAAPADGDVACEAVPTDGSIANLEAVLTGVMEIGVVQSDWQHHAYHGTDAFAGGAPAEDLRSLFSVHSEPFTAVARVDSGIESFDDFVGKRVNIGNPGSGQRATMEVVMEAKGWAPDDFELANELSASEQSLALCHDRVQALVYTVGHPNPSISKVTGLCDARIVPVEGPAIEALLADAPYYAPAEIPGGVYSGNPEPVPTFGVKATVISSAEVSPDLVYTVVKAVFDDLDAFRAIHPAWGGLTAGQMMSEGLSAPLHEGAVRYYRERGLMPAEAAPEPATPEAEADEAEAEAQDPEPEEGAN